jgi:hypothetical protein
VVPEKAEIDAEVVHELTQYRQVCFSHRRRVDAHEFGGDAGDEDLECPTVLQGPTPASRRRGLVNRSCRRSAGLFPLVYAGLYPGKGAETATLRLYIAPRGAVPSRNTNAIDSASSSFANVLSSKFNCCNVSAWSGDNSRCSSRVRA